MGFACLDLQTGVLEIGVPEIEGLKIGAFVLEIDSAAGTEDLEVDKTAAAVVDIRTVPTFRKLVTE